MKISGKYYKTAEGSVTWQSPSNIAFIKYWGKKDNQVPCNPSLSMTLKNSVTKTRVNFKKSSDPLINYYFENKVNKKFQERVINYIFNITRYIPFLNDYSLEIYSENNFPHSTGIASSASFYSSLALALCSIDYELHEKDKNNVFFQRASFLSRLGSGSACRSVYAPYAIWGNTKADNLSSNDYAVKPSFQVNDYFNSLCDAVLIISNKMKAISSSDAHKLMINNPFAQKRYEQANINLEDIIIAMQNNDPERFYKIIEKEALTLHSMLMTSTPPNLLLHPNTIAVINDLELFRKETNLLFGYTIDAGPNIHLIYNKQDKEKITMFIKTVLSEYLYNNHWIDDEAGTGPKEIVKISNGR